jgi:hypothetical protein
MGKFDKYNKQFRMARKEHAFLLRCEGLTHREIGERLGIHRSSAHAQVCNYSYKLNWAMQRTKFYLIDELSRKINE